MHPVRTCVGCGVKKDKAQLIRIVRTADGEIKADITGKSDGRGAYLCRDIACLERAVRRSGFNRTFRTTPGGDVIRELEEQLRAVIGKEKDGG